MKTWLDAVLESWIPSIHPSIHPHLTVIPPSCSLPLSQDYLQKHFPQHAKQLKEGLPDMGQGRVADHLPMDKWISFNSAQRAHYNYLEGFATFALAILISGIFYADVSFLLGVCYVIGREVYSRGYRARGASGRFIGVLLLDLALLVLLVLAFYGSFQASGGVEGFQKVFLGAVQQGQVLVEQAQELIKSFSA